MRNDIDTTSHANDEARFYGEKDVTLAGLVRPVDRLLRTRGRAKPASYRPIILPGGCQLFTPAKHARQPMD